MPPSLDDARGYRNGVPVKSLSPRELEVLGLVAEGLTNAEIGLHLYLSIETVKAHLRTIYLRLNTRSRAHAVTTGFRQGWLR